mmetsp:Transcript_10998/g.21776  ORF Transcript_10998/g.21776 Transcript_10998/m.21776 type:complete len:254 (+) Transcript_10998:149-910(+)
MGSIDLWWHPFPPRSVGMQTRTGRSSLRAARNLHLPMRKWMRTAGAERDGVGRPPRGVGGDAQEEVGGVEEYRKEASDTGGTSALRSVGAGACGCCSYAAPPVEEGGEGAAACARITVHPSEGTPGERCGALVRNRCSRQRCVSTCGVRREGGRGSRAYRVAARCGGGGGGDGRHGGRRTGRVPLRGRRSGSCTELLALAATARRRGTSEHRTDGRGTGRDHCCDRPHHPRVRGLRRPSSLLFLVAGVRDDVR